MKETNWAVA